MAQQSPQSSTRPMQVKVLYTLNDDAKSNCLARCPQPLNIQVARLDQNTEIGIIELRTCIQAIAATSPELVAKLGQDYTVYAYDYSEYETPQVGQGMLSWILANSSSTPTAPAHQSLTMVTGKVCRNALALFSGGAPEALEVKLRLVPVPTTLQSEYLASLEQFRSASNFPGAALDDAFDTAAWSSLLQTSPTFETASPSLSHSNLSAVPPPAQTANEHQRRASASHVPVEASGYFDPSHHTLFSDGPAGPAYAQHGSRPATPSQQSQPGQGRKRANPGSRPSSRNSNRGGRPSLKHAASCVSRMENVETSEAEDGPRPKRARVTQTDWNGSSNFGNNTDSLRVTAAGAASIRGRRPMLNSSLTSDMAGGEFGERPPTPRPRQSSAPKPKPKPIPTLPRALTTPAHELHHPQPTKTLQNKVDPLGILEESSPEKSDRDSNRSSPMDLPSSPPIMRQPSMTPSSPMLSNMSRFQDSGFASGNLEEFLPDFDDSNDNGKLESAASQVNQNQEQPSRPTTPIEADPPPRKLLPGPAPPDVLEKAAAAPWSPTRPKPKRRALSRSQSFSKPAAPAKSSKLFNQTGVTGDGNLESVQVALLSAAIPASDARFRSESLISDVESLATSPKFDQDGQVVTSKAADHSKKKLAIQNKLTQSIQAGEMPRFCNNCGEINTSSWRKAFIKIESGEPNHVQLSEAETGILTWEALERSPEGTILSYRIIKKGLSGPEPGFNETPLCNPCGIWLFKHKQMRPADVWDKPPAPPAPVPAPRRMSTSNPPEKKKRAPKKKKQSQLDGSADDAEQQPEAVDDGQASIEDKSSQRSEDRPVQSTEDMAAKASRRKIQRSNSVGPAQMPARKTMQTAAAKAALQRAIQSSPPRFPGSRVSPIELDVESDLSPKPTNRLLFPSPRKPGEIKSLDPALDKQVSPLSRRKKVHIFDDAANKENVAPANAVDGLDDVFGERGKYLTTPKQGAQTADLLQTPSRSTKRTPLGSKSGHQRRYSNPETPSRSARKGQVETPFSTRIARMLSEANDGLDGNFSMSPFTTQALQDGGMFDFSDLGNGDANQNFSLYDDTMNMSNDIWNNNNFFDGNIDDLLNVPMERDAAPADTSYPSRPNTAMG